MELREQGLREKVAQDVLRLFSIALFATLTFVGLFAIIDYVCVAADVLSAAERLVTPTVVQTMIAATVVEVGAALGVITLALFRTPKNSK